MSDDGMEDGGVWEDRALAAEAEVERLTKWNAEDRAARKNELDRAIEVRENANRVSVRVEMENARLLVEVERLRSALCTVDLLTREEAVVQFVCEALGEKA